MMLGWNWRSLRLLCGVIVFIRAHNANGAEIMEASFDFGTLHFDSAVDMRSDMIPKDDDFPKDDLLFHHHLQQQLLIEGIDKEDEERNNVIDVETLYDHYTTNSNESTFNVISNNREKALKKKSSADSSLIGTFHPLTCNANLHKQKCVKYGPPGSSSSSSLLASTNQ